MIIICSPALSNQRYSGNHAGGPGSDRVSSSGMKGENPMQDSNDRSTTSTEPEDLFAELFTQVFGLEKARFLEPQYPVTDIYDSRRYVDLALRTRGGKIAFEIDGLPW